MVAWVVSGKGPAWGIFGKNRDACSRKYKLGTHSRETCGKYGGCAHPSAESWKEGDRTAVE